MLAPIQKFVCAEDTPVVQTKAGKLRGMIIDDIYTFRGIRYAEAERFMSPKPVTPWDGIVDCQDYGYVSAIIDNPRFQGDINGPHRYWASSEHCQYLNVWTSDMNPSAKKPVMFWIHGGGFANGSSIEMYAYEGENLARDKDVVVVSINHRLNVIGYLDLSEYGPEFAHSGIAGMEDIVEALRWVHDNISQFGGDPDNVTIYGQSGGGGKVQVLMQMSSADGLYHRAIIQSGVLKLGPSVTKSQARSIAKAIVEAIGGIDALCTKDYYYLAEAVKKVQAEGTYVSWAPVPGCGDYEGTWNEVGFRPEAYQIPVMIGSVLSEFAFGVPIFDKNALNAAERSAYIADKYGAEAAPAIEETFKAAYPGINTFYATTVDTLFRIPNLEYLAARSQCPTAPIYAYVVAHEHAFKGGRMSGHCDELPFVFRNDAGIGAVHGTDAATDRKLREEFSGAWTSFACSGNPNCDAIPSWVPYQTDCHATFVFGDQCSETRIDHDAKLVELVQKYAPLPPMFAARANAQNK